MKRSRLYLPKLEPAPRTILEHVITRFPHITPETWTERFEQGAVWFEDKTPAHSDSRYRHGITIYYDRHIADEPEADAEETVVYRDSAIIIADKPPGMPVTPAGSYAKRCLLHRLQETTGVAALAPAHRLDRDTSGLVLLTQSSADRAPYQQLFERNRIRREYLAIAALPQEMRETRWLVKNRIEPGEPWFTQRIVEGPANAETLVELLDICGRRGLFRLTPQSGKTHQLRVHMASIGMPLEGDVLYGTKEPAPGPLRLLAFKLAFTDPLTGAYRSFESPQRASFLEAFRAG